MAVTDLEGRTYSGELLVESGHVRAFVEATGDEPGRWHTEAPPGYAAAALFTVAPAFLWDPEAGNHSRILIHADQKFVFHRPWTVGQHVAVEGRVEKIRMRGDVAWVTFAATALHHNGAPVLESSSLFLMSADEPAANSEGEPEPAPFVKGDADLPSVLELPEINQELAALSKSASRSDLVRYAAASGDFNPLHWDHEVARAAGLPRIVCHGLLSAAWAMQAAARYTHGPAPLREARFRFKQPLLAGDQATVRGSVQGIGDLEADLAILVESVGAPVVEAKLKVATST